MKKVLFTFAAIIAAVFSSCSSGPDSKMISPTSTEFTSGELAKYVEIEDVPSELTYAEKDGTIPTQYIRLKVTLKLKKNGLKDVDPQDIHFIGLLSVATISLVDENGTTVQEVDVKDEDLLKLKKLLTGNKGDTAEIIFEGQFNNSEDAPKWFKNVSQFTPDISGDFIASTKSNSEATTSEVAPSEVAPSTEESSFDLSNVLLPSELKGKVEVISAEKSVSNGFPTMEITFKLLSKVNTSSMCSSYGQMWIFGVGQSEKGVDIKELLPNYREWRSGDSDGREFKSFLEGEPDETITLEFTGTDENSSDVKSDLEKVKKFKLKIRN